MNGMWYQVKFDETGMFVSCHSRKIRRLLRSNTSTLFCLGESSHRLEKWSPLLPSLYQISIRLSFQPYCLWMKNSVRHWRFIGYKRFVDDTGTLHPTHAPRVRRPGSGGMVIREPANHIEGIDSPDSPLFANFDHG